MRLLALDGLEIGSKGDSYNYISFDAIMLCGGENYKYFDDLLSPFDSRARGLQWSKRSKSVNNLPPDRFQESKARDLLTLSPFGASRASYGYGGLLESKVRYLLTLSVWR